MTNGETSEHASAIDTNCYKDTYQLLIVQQTGHHACNNVTPNISQCRGSTTSNMTGHH